MMKVKVGTSFRISSTVYTDEFITPADLNGSTIKVMFKKAITDSDASALLSKTIGSGVTIIDAAAGTLETLISANDTKSYSYAKLFFEVLVKMADGNYIRSSTEEIELEKNIINTLI